MSMFRNAAVENVNNIRMIKFGEDGDFPFESLCRLLVAMQRFRQQFDSNSSTERELLGFVYDAHSAGADPLVDPAARERLVDERVGRRGSFERGLRLADDERRAARRAGRGLAVGQNLSGATWTADFHGAHVDRSADEQG